MVLPATGVPNGATATANDGYEFVNWTDLAGNVVGNQAKYTPKKTGSLYTGGTFKANFRSTGSKTVTFTYLAGLGGTTNPTVETVDAQTGVAQGSTATASEGYIFVN